MAKINVGIPQGTRDFSAAILKKRYFIMQTIREVFELYGYQPLETPAMENLETLMGKYGDEGDKLIFKILNNGIQDPKNAEKAKHAFANVLEGKNDKDLTERALRYDLTIPFARYVSINHGQLHFPFKRYQIQPVWRADRPQKGRYREFYQCDADVVGSLSLLNEVELALIYAKAFRKLNIGVEIRINNRKILAALAELCGGVELMVPISVAIDKLDKVGLDKVKEELAARGLSESSIRIVENYLSINGSNADKLQAVISLLGQSASANQGCAEIEYLLNFPQSLQHPLPLQVDLTLARGLNYYTGIIFEVKAINTVMGSIGGGGRYDNLTGHFGLPDIAGVGISFGVDRIYDVMEAENLFPAEIGSGTRVLFLNYGEQESLAAFNLMQQLRDKNIAAELFHENQKIDKQFKYAERKEIPFVAILGAEELAAGLCKIKNLKTGVQVSLKASEVLDFDFS